MQYQVRTAEYTDLPRILEIYAIARSFMAETGNPNQWGTTHPAREILEEDISRGLLNVVCEDGQIHGVFYFYIGEDPTYLRMEGGQWRSAESYGTIHRIAGDGSGGILKAAVDFALERIGHIRIDTHADNTVMQRALGKQGFSRRGTIFLENGDPRIAYDLLEEK